MNLKIKKENLTEKRIVCPFDQKHSVYERNFQKHLKRCNSRIKSLGDFDVKNSNFTDDKNINTSNEKLFQSHTCGLIAERLELTADSTYKDLTENQLRKVIEFLIELDNELGLFNLQFDNRQDQYISENLKEKNEYQQKHMRQISSIVGHVNTVVDSIKDSKYCLIELGAGRGRLSYWFEQSRYHRSALNKDSDLEIPNILLIERGSQRLKFDSLIRKTLDEKGGELSRIKIDLKDLSLNQVPIVNKSKCFVAYGKHLCGIGTDFALRCIKKSILDSTDSPKFRALVLAVCCHHQCEWESLCGQDFLISKGINSMLFYIIRSISSWSTSGDRNITAPQEYIFGHQRQKVGRICKNLIDLARIQYLKSIQLPEGVSLQTRHFYYVSPDVTLENTIITAFIEL